ncbi:quinol monooxygenase YgiN [Clostridium algifaecis]|uniref:Quinol monooxygenase YgiN n=1 Tax=Clostridium algifaecis TaxID=1472040 RepID=A0ABS4KPR0_9CLOT|nr:putative quinol monooxygenase [Clostridium algifaecis]MBP2032025.1 quinol monooxygenase YgiN [Clostridium algifaecis]
MVKVVAKAHVKTGQTEKFKELSSEMIKKSRKEEANIAYGLYQDIEDNQILTFMEEWKDKAGLDKHMKTDHFVNTMAKLVDLQENDMEINIYTICL